MSPTSNPTYRVILPLSDMDMAVSLVDVAAALTRAYDGRLTILSIVEVPEGQSLSEGTSLAQERRQVLEKIAHQSSPHRVEIKTLVRVSRQVWQEIAATVEEEGCDLLLLGWSGVVKTPGAMFGTTIDKILASPPCDIAIYKPRGGGSCRRILLPARGGPYAQLSMRVARAICAKNEGCITVLHVFQEGIAESDRAAEEQPYSDFMREVENSESVRKVLTVARSVENAILSEAQDHHLVIMGASAQAGSPGLFGLIPETVMQKTNQSVIIVKTWQPIDPELLHQGNVQQVLLTGLPQAETLSNIVDKWFAENTFHAKEFADLDRLVAAKRASGLTISLGLPALNEEETVGTIISMAKKQLMDEHPLLDEIVLIDSRSSDRTVEIATDLGIPVYVHQDILPEVGSVRGKGEALWKSLHILKGDIVAWIDTDIRNMNPQFIYGLIGPLLKEPRIKFVKGYYRRPLEVGGVLHETGGGRVTELLVRPLFNLFFPELSGLIQPLSGEYAGRREVLEQLSFFTGYGVETGLLIDLLQRYGLAAIGQVNLEERIHRNQSLAALSMMSFAITQVIVKRLEARARLQLTEELNKTMKLIRFEDNQLGLMVRNIEDRERPPIITIPAYRQKMGRLAPSLGFGM
ncbi:MAG: glucosyl-3-phosphoglycerate synthase [Chloroflexi bacterium]|nr:glucosyl-3-phosphoglycerate synthase [Chloroflexota bacterium]